MSNVRDRFPIGCFVRVEGHPQLPGFFGRVIGYLEGTGPLDTDLSVRATSSPFGMQEMDAPGFKWATWRVHPPYATRGEMVTTFVPAEEYEPVCGEPSHSTIPTFLCDQPKGHDGEYHSMKLPCPPPLDRIHWAR